MPIIKIDNNEYDLDTLPQKAKEQLQSIQYVDAELQRLQAQVAAMQTARIAYGKALQEALINAPSPTEGDTLKLGWHSNPMPDFLPCAPSQSDLQTNADLQQLAAESMGWQPLAEGAYLHLGAKDNAEAQQILHVVGIPDIALAGLNVLLLT